MTNKPTAFELLKQLKALNAQKDKAPSPAEDTKQTPPLETTAGQDQEILQTSQDLKSATEEAKIFLELHQLREEYSNYKAKQEQLVADQIMQIGKLEQELEELSKDALKLAEDKTDLKKRLTDTEQTRIREKIESETIRTSLETYCADLAEDSENMRGLADQARKILEEKQRLQQELAEAELQYKDLEETSEAYEKDSRKDLADEENKTRNLESQLRQLRDEATTQQNTIRDQESKITNLTKIADRLNEIATMHNALREKLDKTEGDLLSKDEQLTILKREYSVYKFTQEEKAKELDGQLTKKQKELTLAQERVTALEQDVTAYLAQIEESQKTSQETSAELERINQDLTQARENAKLAQDEIFLLKTQNEGIEKLLQDKEREFEERKDFLQNQYSALEQERDSLKTQAAEYEAQLSTRKELIKRLRSAITEQRSIIHKLRGTERANEELAEARETDSEQYEAKIQTLEETNTNLQQRLYKAKDRIIKQRKAITELRARHARIKELEEQLETLTADKELVDGQLTDLAQERDHLQEQNRHAGQEYLRTIDELSDQLIIERRKYREKGVSFREYVLAATITIGMLAFGYQMIEYAKILTQEPAKAVDIHKIIKKK